MMERVTLPLEGALTSVAPEAEGDPLPALRSSIQQALRQTVRDPQTRRVFEVATHKVEYVDSLCAVRRRHLELRSHWVERIRAVLRRSAALRRKRLAIPATSAAEGLQALVDGLIQNWLLDTAAFDLEATGTRTVDAYLRGLGLD
jgi:TetR/AcrR family acrAB operon transcriptional repressor